MTQHPAAAERLDHLLTAWSRRLDASVPGPTPRSPALVPHLAAAADYAPDDALASLLLSGIPVTPELVRARLAARFPYGPDDPWPAPDPAARIKAPAPREFLPGEIDPLTLAALDGYLACQLAFKPTVLRLLQGDPPGAVLADDMPRWAAALLGPWAGTGLVPDGDATGFRHRMIRSPLPDHRPPAPAEIPACCELLWARGDLIRHPLLAHLGLLWIRPWPAGNGRLARLTHAALALGTGKPWPRLAAPDRTAYLAAVAAAFTTDDPLPLASLHA